MPSNHLIFCHPLLLLPSIFLSISVFSSESGLHIRWPKYWSFSFNINPSNEYSGLISFRMDWLDLLSVQGTLKSLLQHHSSKASILQCSAFFIVQLSHPYMTIGWNTVLKKKSIILLLSFPTIYDFDVLHYIFMFLFGVVFLSSLSQIDFFFMCLLVSLSDLISNCDFPYIFLLLFSCIIHSAIHFLLLSFCLSKWIL